MKFLPPFLRAAWLPCLAAFWCLFSVTALHAQPGTGYIQITCEPGVQVFLDGAFKGLTNAEQGGLILAGVSPGRHQLKVLKEGFQAQENNVEISAGGVKEFKVQPFTPKLEIAQRGAAQQQQVVQKVGSLLIQSIPVACKITINALGLRAQEKDQDEIEFNKVPTGTYAATFAALGKTVNHTFEIADGQRTHLFVNILEGKVQDVNAEAHARRSASAVSMGGGSDRRVTSLGLDLASIAPGPFTMGSANGDSDERPVTQVTISRGFWLGRTEVTQAQWSAVMGSNPSGFQGDDRPVEQVSWQDAMEFCRKLTERERAAGRLPDDLAYTLPTEAQWEYACRAGTTGDYAGNLDAMAWYGANSGNQTHPVGQKQANAWGLHDMHGNVWEWCSDLFGNYPGGSVTDPTGAPSGSFRVRRGGSWGNGAVRCRSALRRRVGPGYRGGSLGFRLALSSVR